MNEYIIKCPCCDKKLKVLIDKNSGKSTAFLLEEKEISREDLFKKLGIELGIEDESEVRKCEC